MTAPASIGAEAAGQLDLFNATPTTFSHPRASRESLLLGHRVAYEFRRARRKSIGFIVGDDGLVVSAPRWVGLAEVQAAVHAIYTDGLTHVSVFIEPFRADRHRSGGASSGATHTWMQAHGAHWITVVGDVPAATLKQFAGALESKPR